MRAHLFILKTLLIRRDLRNLLIKHAVQHHKCMPANNSSITNHYQFILNCVFPTRLCASGDVDVWRSNEQWITRCYDYVLPTTACHCGHAIVTWPAIQVLCISVGGGSWDLGRPFNKQVAHTVYPHCRAVTSIFFFYLSKNRSRSIKIYSSRSGSSSKKIYLSKSRK